jgi:hypothetical protein
VNQADLSIILPVYHTLVRLWPRRSPYAEEHRQKSVEEIEVFYRFNGAVRSGLTMGWLRHE